MVGSEDASSKEPLGRRVTRWLNKQGFPLEFRVARAFQKAGFEVKQSHYVDIPNHPRPREIDVLAIYDTRAMFGEPRYELYVECKWSKDKPWVVFSSDAESVPPPSVLLGSVRTNLTGEGVLWLLEEHEVPWRAPFGSTAPICHGGRQVVFASTEKDRRDRFYATMQSVTTITSASLVRVNPFPVPQFEPCTFAFPVVVVEAPLFRASLVEGTDEMTVTPIQRARVLWRGLRADTVSWVELVQADAVEAFAAEVVDGIRNTQEVLVVQEAIREALQKESTGPLAPFFHGKKLNPPIIVPTILRALATRYEEERRKQQQEGST
jgi:hypothetical protein